MKPEDLLAAAEESLVTAEYAFKELIDNSLDRKIPSLRNVLVFGQLFNRQLASLRRHSAKFDTWFDRHQKNMSMDERIRSVMELRSDLLERKTDPDASLHITQLRLPSDGSSHGNRPRNARSFFVGDRIGGTGWEIALPDGSVEKFYVYLPPAYRPSRHRFESEPGGGPSIESLVRHYVSYLREMMQYARFMLEQ